MLSTKLKILRNKHNITQQELADALNISRSTIAGYEAESKQPSYEMIVKLSRFFNVSTDYLLDAGLFAPDIYELVSLYRFPLIDKLSEYGYLTNEMRKKISECPNELCVEFLSAYISDVTGNKDSIKFSTKGYLGELGDKLYHSLTSEQIEDLPYTRFDEIIKNKEQANIVEDIENLPYEEQQKIRDYITMYHKLNSSVAADEELMKKTGTDSLGK